MIKRIKAFLNIFSFFCIIVNLQYFYSLFFPFHSYPFSFFSFFFLFHFLYVTTELCPYTVIWMPDLSVLTKEATMMNLGKSYIQMMSWMELITGLLLPLMALQRKKWIKHYRHSIFCISSFMLLSNFFICNLHF